ncbi:hypothetical protein D9757_011382 [Collybiopsis confluens]|uniref:Uncharacterized protein n=1 Tax=Collybiopsis confluens TaxID=2823264 RepID=A0A8H5GLD0_9AGAR|nr:hypothetical protein D9757_011382 [Collybiopsis confluens]
MAGKPELFVYSSRRWTSWSVANGLEERVRHELRTVHTPLKSGDSSRWGWKYGALRGNHQGRIAFTPLTMILPNNKCIREQLTQAPQDPPLHPSHSGSPSTFADASESASASPLTAELTTADGNIGPDLHPPSVQLSLCPCPTIPNLNCLHREK